MAESSGVAKPANPKVRYEWYQTETHVVITVLHKNIDSEKLKIDCQTRNLTIPLPDVQEPLSLNLSHEVRPDGLTYKVTPVKLEIKLPKVDGIQWKTLEGGDQQAKSTVTPLRSKNWDEVVNSLPEEDDEDPMNKLFRKIYAEGSDEIKKAMNKSFMESGGTVLSTNWKDVEKEEVKMRTPEGLEFKKWD